MSDYTVQITHRSRLEAAEKMQMLQLEYISLVYNVCSYHVAIAR